MGKDKSSQRTKGNLKPSSSGRSAEVLGGAKGFIGFGTHKSSSIVPAASQISFDEDTQLSTLFRVTLRKISKKDSVTKIKGLQEFESLCHSEDQDAVKVCLSYWPRIYQKLSVDSDIRVREHAQLAHSSFVSKVGKNLAPYLKSVVPVWLLAMADPHGASASTALSSFQTMFSKEKRSEVLLFCQKEIFEFISSNLLSQFSQILSADSAKGESSVEDVKGRAIRLLCSSLKSLTLFLDMTNALDDKKNEIAPNFQSIIEHEKFWKFPNNSSVMVKISWFDTIKSLLQYDAEIIRPHTQRLFDVVIGCLKCSPSVQNASIPYIWVTLMHMCKKFPEFVNESERRELIFQCIFAMVKESSRSRLGDFAPFLLPLLKATPLKSVSDPNPFYREFCTSLAKRLSDGSMSAQKTEWAVLVRAFGECLKHIAEQRNADCGFWKDILESEVLDLVMLSVSDESRFPGSVLHGEISELLFFLFKVFGSLPAGTTDVYDLNLFFEKLMTLFLTHNQTGNPEQVTQISRFLVSLKEFSPRTNESPEGEEVEVPDMSISEDYMRLLSLHISPIINDAFISYQRHKTKASLALFVDLLNDFESDELYKQLSNVSEETESKSSFLKTFVNLSLAPGVPFVDLAVPVFVKVYRQLPSESRQEILCKLECISPLALKILLEKLLEDCDKVTLLWVQSSGFEVIIMNSLQKLLNDEDVCGTSDPEAMNPNLPHKELVSFVVKNASKSHRIFSVGCLAKIFEFLDLKIRSCESVKQKSRDCSSFLRTVLGRSVDLLKNLLETPLNLPVAEIIPIMKSFFRLLYRSSLWEPKDSLRGEVETCLISTVEKWAQQGSLFGNDSHLKENGFISYALTEAKAIVLESSSDFKKIIQLADFVKKLMHIVVRFATNGTDGYTIDHYLKLMLENLFLEEFEWKKLQSKVSSLHEAPTLIKASFAFKNFPLPALYTDAPLWDTELIKVSLFMVKIYVFLYSSEVSSRGLNAKDTLELLDEFIPSISYTVFAFFYSKFINEINVFTEKKFSSIVISGCRDLEKSVEKLLPRFDPEFKLILIQHLVKRCKSEEGSNWNIVLFEFLRNQSLSDFEAENFYEKIQTESEEIEVKQILVPYLKVSKVLSVFVKESEALFSRASDPDLCFESVSLIASSLENLPDFDPKTEADCYEKLQFSLYSTFKVFCEWRNADVNVFSLGSASDASWSRVSLLVSVIRFLRAAIERHNAQLLPSHWDFILCALTSWAQSVADLNEDLEKSTVLAVFASECSRLVLVVSEFVRECEADSSLKSKAPTTLADEWRDFFAPSLFTMVLIQFLEYTKSFEQKQSVVLFYALKNISSTVKYVQSSTLKTITLPPLFNVLDEDSTLKLPDNIQFVLNHFCPWLVSAHPLCQQAAYHIVDEVIPDMMTSWDESPLVVDDKDDSPPRHLPPILMNSIENAAVLAKNDLKQLETGGGGAFVPHTKAFSSVGGYLMAWLLLLKAMRKGTEANLQMYACYIRESSIFFDLLTNLFKLMPSCPNFEDSSLESDLTMFSSPFNVKTSEPNGETIWWLSCRVFLRCLKQLPASVRTWWMNLDRAEQQIVDAFTALHVSPILIANEMKSINESTTKFDNMTIKTRPGVREVVAVYTIDDASMELVLRMSPNYPLSSVVLEDHKRVGVSISQWRNWLFGLNTMLSHRNTPLLSSLEFWKNNVDQKFRGLEECYICYYVLHGSNHQLPKLLCKTCKKKYHAACLYKWFNTSNNSTCPICRSLF